MSRKLPALHFYPGDWFKDPGIMALDSIERGVWFQMLLLMFESKRRGYLELNGARYPEQELAKLFKISVKKLQKIEKKLTDFDVISVEKCSNILFSRRMARDEEERQLFVNVGKSGGRGNKKTETPPFLKTTQKKKGSPEDEDEGEVKGLKDNEGVSNFTIMDQATARAMRDDIWAIDPGHQFDDTEEAWAAKLQSIRRCRKVYVQEILEIWKQAREDSFYYKVVLTPWDLDKHWQKVRAKSLPAPVQPQKSRAAEKRQVTDSWLEKTENGGGGNDETGICEMRQDAPKLRGSKPGRADA